MVSDLLIKQKFLDHREWNVNEANRDFESMERWMEMRTKYTGDVVIPFAIKHNIVMYPDENDHMYINFTQKWIEFYNKEKPNIEAVLESVPKEEQHRYLSVIEFLTLRTLVKYIGMSDRQFCELPKKDPETCKLLFELEDLVFRLLNAEQFEKRAEEQDQMLKEREDFKKRIGN